jgi:hypothetical protein
MLAGLSGSRASEQSRQVGISKELASFVREMNPHPTTTTAPFDDVAHPSPTYISGVGGIEGTFGDEFDIRTRVDATLTITSNDAKMNTWFGFKSNGALYLRGDGWDDMDIREVNNNNSSLHRKKVRFGNLTHSVLQVIQNCVELSASSLSKTDSAV